MNKEIKFSRHFARASAWTFTIPPIAELLSRYIENGKGWADPFAGYNSLAEYTNDLDPKAKAIHHMEAQEFAEKIVPGRLNGVLFDPPYSYRQISEHYKAFGKKATAKDTSYNFYRRTMRPLVAKIKDGGYAISFGWNTNGFGKQYGFEIIEIMIVAHGMHHNDTLVTVERKLKRLI